MINIIFAGALALISADPFEFRGENTSTVVDTANNPNCMTDDGIVSCAQVASVAGVEGVIYSSAYHEGRLNGLLGQFREEHFLTLLRAFTEKYGEPTMSKEEWRNRAGASFDNTVATWAFSDGTLTLKQIGSRMGNGSFRFTATVNNPPASAPKVDF
ncbi:hypothetical protein [Brevundimonas sp. NPDC058933]|uniref:hypothetical protein n=1 Tax=Brevundimonas sp. NPDC058933 TaxID=3346673 RepID=UPI003BEEEB8B